jgi:hypothetical protein
VLTNSSHNIEKGFADEDVLGSQSPLNTLGLLKKWFTSNLKALTPKMKLLPKYAQVPKLWAKDKELKPWFKKCVDLLCWLVFTLYLNYNVIYLGNEIFSGIVRFLTKRDSICSVFIVYSLSKVRAKLHLAILKTL